MDAEEYIESRLITVKGINERVLPLSSVRAAMEMEKAEMLNLKMDDMQFRKELVLAGYNPVYIPVMLDFIKGNDDALKDIPAIKRFLESHRSDELNSVWYKDQCAVWRTRN